MGDRFLNDVIGTLQGMKTQAKLKKTELPYLYEMYNFKAFYINPLSDVTPTIVRIYNSLTEALNKYEHLPKYILVVMDKDIVSDVQRLHFDCGLYNSFEDNINWLLKNIAKAILVRRDNLKLKRLGAVPKELPIVCWVKMLARLHTCDLELAEIWKL